MTFEAYSLHALETADAVPAIRRPEGEITMVRSMLESRVHTVGLAMMTVEELPRTDELV